MALLEKCNGLAVVEARDEICQGCNMNIPPQMFVELRKIQRPFSASCATESFLLERKRRMKAPSRSGEGVLYCDGASSGNPGESGIGAVLLLKTRHTRYRNTSG